MNSLKSVQIGLLAGVALAAACGLAAAQSVETVNANGTLSGALGLTGNSDAGSRLALPALDTPASVTTITGDTIRLRGDPNINAAVTRAVGITTNTSVGGGGNSVAVRGFNGSSVAYLYDGIRNEAGLGNLGWPYDPWTVDRVEVLNGPASVLYGTGGIGGAINVVPRVADAMPSTTVRLSGASFNTYRAALDSTGPITDDLLYRLDVSHQSSDGYINNGKSSSIAVSASAAYIVSPTLKLTLSHDFALIKPMNYNGLPLVGGKALHSLRYENYQTGDSTVYFDENNTRFDIAWTPLSDIVVRNISSAVVGDRDWKQGPAQLFYQASSSTVVRGSYGDYVQKQLQFNNQTEVRISTPLAGHENTLSVGGDLEHMNFKRLVTTWPGVTSTVSLNNPVPGTYPTTGAVLSPAQDMRMWREALFAEDRFVVLPGLSLVGGLRYDHANVDRQDLTPAAIGTVVSRAYDPVNWRVGAVYDVIPNLNLYAQYSNAVDFVSNLCCISAVQMSFRPSRGTQLEAGVKQSLLDGRLEWTLALYQIIKKDLLVPDPNNLAVLQQVGAQSSQGVEASLAYDFGNGLRLEANGTILNPKYDLFQEVVSGVRISRSGNSPTNVPSESANFWATWQITSAWLVQGGVRYVGRRFIDTANTLHLPGYTVVDAGVRWNATDRMAIDLRANNLFDAFYAYNFTSDGHGGGNWNVGAPQNLELSLTASL